MINVDEIHETTVEELENMERSSSSERKYNAFSDACNAITIGSAVYSIIRAEKYKKRTGEYSQSHLLSCAICGFCVGRIVVETVQNFPASVAGKIYKNTAAFAKNAVTHCVKILRKEVE